ncbi:MAG TPA: hypothetical protein VGG16_18760 [Streptosporangiaceae bacterium]|jgi:hypothetical protein
MSTAFDTADMTHQVNVPHLGTLPRDVAEVCALTWECVAPPQGPNEHCDVRGYNVIARAFISKLPARYLR